MSNISVVEAKLPPGFRFHPRDEELVCDYLMKKLTHTPHSPLLIEVDLNKCEPWDIPETACVGGKEWYFYSQRDRKYATGIRTNRATASGYWKATGKDRTVHRKGSLVGMRKTLVFYHGRAPKGKKTNWVMHEFRLHGHMSPKISALKEDWALCRVFYKNRETVSSRPTIMESSCNYDHVDDRGSSSLPALLDPFGSLDQTLQPNNLNDQHDGHQLPCFSPFSHNQTNPIFPRMTQLLEPNTLLGQITMIPTPSDPFSCDNNVLKSVLNQLTRMESKNGFDESPPPPSLGEGSSVSYLSDMPNMWNNP